MAKPATTHKKTRPYRLKEDAPPASDQAVLAARLGWLTLGAVWLFLAAGLVTFDPADAPSHAVWPLNEQVSNITGPFGAFLSYHTLRTLGLAVAIPMVFAGVAITRRAMHRPVQQIIVRTLGVILMTAAVSATLAVVVPAVGPLPGLPGGVVGFVAASELLPRFDLGGSLIWLSLLILVSLIVTCDRLVLAAPRAVWRALVPAAKVSAAATVAAANAAGSVAVKANAAADLASSGSRKAGGGLMAGLRALIARAKPGVKVRPNDLPARVRRSVPHRRRGRRHRVGPVITLYHVRLAPGTKVARSPPSPATSPASLKAVNIRIVSQHGGQATPSASRCPTPPRRRSASRNSWPDRDRFAKMKLPMFLGKDASGEPLIADLTKMPHMLIAGTTGSGKSVCMNTIIMGFLYTKKPNELKLVLVDPKMVEMSQFKDIPHLMCPVVTEMSKAAAILEWAVPPRWTSATNSWPRPAAATSPATTRLNGRNSRNA
jgi:hypothetical protein